MSAGVPEFWARKYEADAAKYWDLFYKRNEDRFFKDRYWTSREFGELVENPDQPKVRFDTCLSDIRIEQC